MFSDTKKGHKKIQRLSIFILQILETVCVFHSNYSMFVATLTKDESVDN